MRCLGKQCTSQNLIPRLIELAEVPKYLGTLADNTHKLSSPNLITTTHVRISFSKRLVGKIQIEDITRSNRSLKFFLAVVPGVGWVFYDFLNVPLMIKVFSAIRKYYHTITSDMSGYRR